MWGGSAQLGGAAWAVVRIGCIWGVRAIIVCSLREMMREASIHQEQRSNTLQTEREGCGEDRRWHEVRGRQGDMAL